MAYIYTSTDSLEAEKIINPYNNKDYNYHDLDMSFGEDISKRIGFNPMCSIKFDEDTPLEALDDLAMKLLNQGLFVTIDTKKNSQNYIPSDITERNELIKYSLIKKKELVLTHLEPGYCLMLYSNNPCEIREI